MALESTKLDDLDWKLVEALQEDARLTFAELGRRVSLSPPAVAERVRRLELSGVLTGYHAEVDPARLGLPLQAVIRLVVSNGAECQALAGRLKPVPEVLSCHRVTGSDSYIVRVAVRSVEHLEDLIGRLMPFSGDTITAIVLTTPVAFKAITRDLADPAPAVEATA